MAKALTLNQRLVLKAINDAPEPDYLASLQRRIASTYRKDVSLGRMMDSLNKFLKLGYVAAEETPVPGRRPVKRYRVLPNGRAALGGLR